MIHFVTHLLIVAAHSSTLNSGNSPVINCLLVVVHELPLRYPELADRPRGTGDDVNDGESDTPMAETCIMTSLEEKLRGYEVELTQLRIENEQLRLSSQAFGELAERLSVALKTASRVESRHTPPVTEARGRSWVALES